MKEIKNYLHLYLGCECIEKETGKTLKLSRVSNMSISAHSTESSQRYHLDFEDIQPILTPLKNILSIKSDEKKQLLDAGLMYSHADDNYTIWNPETVRLACSFGIDLFNLIDEGLAVDKSTIISTSAH